MPKYDLHVHTHLSSCAKRTAFAADYITHARELGLKAIAFTDHMWDSAIPGASDWYAPQNFAHISELKAELPPEADLKILFGCETECDMHGTVGISEEVAAQLDILLVPNSHTHMTDFVMPSALRSDDAAHGRFLVAHFMHIMQSPIAKYITAVPHPFAPVACPTDQNVVRSISTAALEECCAAARETGIALEINTSVFAGMSEDELRDCAYVRLFEIARQAGCRFTVGSDAHDIAQMDTITQAEKFARIVGITEDMFLSF